LNKRLGVRFSGKSLELSRKYMWRKEFIPILYKYLDIHPGQTIVDVGCGTGFLTRLVARALKGDGEVIGIDRNERLFQYARRLTREAGLDSIVSFRRGDANKLPFVENFADRVICQAVLWTIRDPKKAVKEMIRVCKPGGLVGAIEFAADSVNFYYPESERLSELQTKSMRAGVEGYRKLYGYDRNIGWKLPSYFHELGLERIRLDGYAHAWLQQDDRIPVRHRVEMYRRDLEWLRGRLGNLDAERRVSKAGGMKPAEIR